jgi:hypothetical protein
VASIGCLGAAVALGLLSTRTRGSVVIIGTYAVLLGYCIIPLLILSRLVRTGVDVEIVTVPLVITNPLIGCVAALEGGPRGLPGFHPILHPVINLAGMGLLVASAAVLFAWCLRREADLRPVARRARPRRTRPIPGNPVHWYETRIRLPGRGRRWRLIGSLGFLALVVLTFLLAYDIDEPEWVPVGTFLIAMEVQALILVTASVRGAWTGGDPRSEMPLLTTPISTGGVALQKIRSVLTRSIYGLVGLAAILALATSHRDFPTFSGDRGPVEWSLCLALVMASSVLMVIGMATLGALLARATASSTRGTVGALSIFIGQAIAVPFLLYLLRWESELAVTVMMALDPLILTPIVLLRGLDDIGAYSLAALVLEAFLVSGLLLWTLARWGDLSRRKA